MQTEDITIKQPVMIWLGLEKGSDIYTGLEY